jgi:hypothetical protein
VVPGGGLSPDHSRWISSRSSFLLPVKVLSRVFRGKFIAGLRRLFARIRYFGFLANRQRARMLPLCRALLNQAPPTETPVIARPTLWECPHCHGRMHLVARLSVAQIFFAERKEAYQLDSS